MHDDIGSREPGFGGWGIGHSSCVLARVDWLVTGSDFDRKRFEGLWADVVHSLVGRGRKRPTRRRVG